MRLAGDGAAFFCVNGIFVYGIYLIKFTWSHRLSAVLCDLSNGWLYSVLIHHWASYIHGYKSIYTLARTDMLSLIDVSMAEISKFVITF